MGFFSLYCGLIYNDFSSMPIMIADTCWTTKGGKEGGKGKGKFKIA